MEATNVASRKRTARSELESDESRTSISRDRRLRIRPLKMLMLIKSQKTDEILTRRCDIVPPYCCMNEGVQQAREQQPRGTDGTVVLHNGVNGGDNNTTEANRSVD